MKLSRREFLVNSGIATSSIALYGCETLSERKPRSCVAPDDRPLILDLYRPSDGLAIRVESYGFDRKTLHGKQCLYLTKELQCKTEIDPLLVFVFPPQHHGETALPLEKIRNLNDQVDRKELDTVLESINLVSGKESRLVFGIPRNKHALPIKGKGLPLTLEALLNWSDFSYRVEDEISDPYSQEVDDHRRKYFLGLETWKGSGFDQVSAIDLPTGFYLQPSDDHIADFAWKTPQYKFLNDGYAKLWSAFAFDGGSPSSDAMSFSLVDIWGVEYDLKKNDYLEQAPPSEFYYRDTTIQMLRDFENFPIDLYDRMEMAITLVPRFSSKDENGSSINHVFSYKGGSAPDEKCPQLTYKFSACYQSPRILIGSTYRISSEGGWLDLKGAWDVLPSCTIKGWVQKTILGRDTFAKVVRQGYLYPFGFKAELVEETQRTYLRGGADYLVAPLVREIYVRVQQPSILKAESLEECFQAVRCITLRTPPLDTEELGKLSEQYNEHKKLDAFMPIVEGQPFSFEVEGIDHANQWHSTPTPLYFISNRQTSREDFGRFPEGGVDSSKRKDKLPDNAIKDSFDFVQVSRGCEAENVAVHNFIKLIDHYWEKRNFRFAAYSGSPIAIAPVGQKNADTSVEVQWIEWVRGRRPDAPKPADTLKTGTEYVTRVMSPRVRTMRITLQNLRQFAGQDEFPDMLACYRDLRFHDTEKNNLLKTLDPEETAEQEVFDTFLLNPNQFGNDAGTFLYVLPTQVKEDNNIKQAEPKEIAQKYYPFAIETVNGDASLRKGVAELLAKANNLVQFGKSKNTESLGALTTPDAPIALLTRQLGPLGDKREYLNDFRVSYSSAAALAAQPLHKLHLLKEQQQQLSVLKSKDADFPGAIDMGISDIFGDRAEVIPGISFSEVIDYTLQLGGSEATKARRKSSLNSELKSYQKRLKTFQQRGDAKALLDAENLVSPETRKGENGLKWQYEFTGIDWLLALIGNEPGQISPANFFQSLLSQPPSDEPREPLEFGIKGSLDWETDAFKKFETSVFSFLPKRGETRFYVHAEAYIDIISNESNISASSAIEEFEIKLLKALVVDFKHVAFSIDAKGEKEFDPAIHEVRFEGVLSFVDQLKNLLKDLEDEIGVKTDITPQRVQLSQTIAIPPPEADVQTMPVGPAIISNLSFNWKVIVPLLDKKPMSFHTSIGTRPAPVTIQVGIYGGRFHAGLYGDTEQNTGIDFSMSWGGVFQAKWGGVAKGCVTLTAGLSYSQVRDSDGSRKAKLYAFAEFVGKLVIAKIFSLCAHIFIALGNDTSKGEDVIYGVAKCSCSFKMGFVRYSYHYEVYKEERKTKGRGQEKRLQSINSGSSDDMSGAHDALVFDESTIKPTGYQPFVASNPDQFGQWREFFNAYES